eukprot:m.56011 g.56011  ORF g.56011 m.56011 type:complete len:101 (+) comp12983_c0_seq4:91-393(+)
MLRVHIHLFCLHAAVALVLHHYFVFSHFADRYYPFDQVVAYFTICVWLVPFVLFISLSANEYTLPTATISEEDKGLARRSGGLLAILQYLKEKFEDRVWV